MSNTNTNLQTQTSNALHNAIMEAGGKDRPPMLAPEGSSKTTTEGYMENYKNVSQDIRNQLDAEAEAVQIILTWIDNDIYFTVDSCPNACEMWKEIERLKQGESINVQDLETNLYWEFGKFTSQDGESLESYYLRFYKMMNELVRNQCDVTNHQVNVQFLLQLQPKWQSFVTLVKQSQEWKTVSYHKLYDILKQHQNEVNKIRAERLAPATRNKGKAIVNSPSPTYDQEPEMVAKDDALSKEKEIDKLMALISLSFKKIYKPANNNLRTSSNTSRRVVNVAGARDKVGTHVVQQSRIQFYNCKEYGHVARECQKPKRAKDAAYHKEKMLLGKQEEAGFQLNAKQADWRDNTNDEPDDQKLEARYLYMAQIQEVTPDAATNFGPIFDAEPLQKVQNDNDNYNVFVNEREHLEQPEFVNDTYPYEQDEHNIIIYSLDMSHDREQADQDDDDLAKERDFLAFLIKKLKCEIDDSKNRNKFLELSNKTLIDKLRGEIEDFKTINKILKSSNNHFKKTNNELSKTNQLMFKNRKKFQAELDRYHDVNYASKVEIDCAKAKGDLMSYKMESQKSLNEHTRKINDLNKTISEMKKDLFAHQETISIMSQEKEAQNKFYKTHEDKELEKVIALENKVKFFKPEFLKKAQRANPRLYDIVVKRERLEKDLSKSNTTSKSFKALQQHAINLEFALHQNLKAQLQDKDIAIIKLKKLIEKIKGKSVETKFEKPSVIRQPNAFKSQRQSVLGSKQSCGATSHGKLPKGVMMNPSSTNTGVESSCFSADVQQSLLWFVKKDTDACEIRQLAKIFGDTAVCTCDVNVARAIRRRRILSIVRVKKFPEVKGWLVEDLVNYHLKELRCSAQCHMKKSIWINSRGDVHKDPRSAKVLKGFESPNLQGSMNSPGSSMFVGTSPWTNADSFLPRSKLSTLAWEMVASLKYALIALIEVDGEMSIGDQLSGKNEQKKLGKYPVSGLKVALEQDELLSSVEPDFQARLDGGRMYSGHLEAK
ncbi:hypothetical protein Tco_0435841 [Tanacetum coccineum]